jgi:hypothetical protein
MAEFSGISAATPNAVARRGALHASYPGSMTVRKIAAAASSVRRAIIEWPLLLH